MLLLVTLTLAVVPSLLLVWFFRSRDAHPEPAGVLWKTFGLGVASILPTLVVALPAQRGVEVLGLGPLLHGLADAFFAAALPEEAWKLAVLLLYAARHRAFDEPMDGLVYGVMASLGFATLENVLYTAQGGLGLALLRAFTAVPMHACCGAIMGYHVGRWRFARETGAGPGSLLAAYAVPTLLHGLYDAPLLALGRLLAGRAEGADLSAPEALVALGAMAGAVAVLGVAGITTLVLVARARREQREAAAEGRFLPVLEEVAAPVAMVGSRWAWLLVLGGGGLASLGGLFGLVGVLALTSAPEPGAPDRLATVLGAAVLGLPPLAVGLVLFLVGVRRLPRPAPRVSRYGGEPR